MNPGLDVYQQTEMLARRWESVNDDASAEVYHMGFAPIQRPEFTCPILDPQMLTKADLHSYAETHARFLRWHGYAEYTFARIQSILLGIKRQISQLESQLKVYYADYKNPATGRTYSLDDRKNLAENNPRYVELLLDQTKFEEMKILMEPHVNSLSKSVALIGRHVELRKMDMENERLNSSLPSRGMYPQR